MGKMKKKLYIHVGLTKTGSTSLQNFLTENRRALSKNGVYYPDLGHSSRPFTDRGLLIEKDIRGQRKNILAGNTDETLIDSIKEDILSNSNDVAIISNENFSNFTNSSIKYFEKFKKYFDVAIVFYLRRQDLWLESYYQEIVKNSSFPIAFAGLVSPDYSVHMEGSKENLLLRRIHNTADYHGMLTRWASVFGRSNIVARNYNRLEGNDIVSDFMQLLGLDLSDKFKIGRRFNLSASTEATEFKRYLNKTGIIWEEYLERREAYAAIEKLTTGPKFVGFNPQERAEFLLRFKQGNDSVATEYIEPVGVKKELFDVDFNQFPTSNIPTLSASRSDYLLRKLSTRVAIPDTDAGAYKQSYILTLRRLRKRVSKFLRSLMRQIRLSG